MCAENWRGAPDLGPRISEVEGPPAHQQILLQGRPPSFVPPTPLSWLGRLMLGMGKARHLTDQLRRIARQGPRTSENGAAFATEALLFPSPATLFPCCVRGINPRVE